MIYRIRNIVSGYDYVETEELANNKLIDNKNAFIQQEISRFSVAKITVKGNNTTWSSANLEDDPEDYEYQVFNQYMGQHEVFPSLSTAKNRRQEMIDQFVTDSGFSSWDIVDAIPPPVDETQPITEIEHF